MVDKFALTSINTKPMVMMEYTGPDVTFDIPPKTCIEILNAHGEGASNPNLTYLENIRLKGRNFNICSFFSGSEESGQFIGIPNKIICLLLPDKVDPQEYYSVIIKIASRLLLDNDKIPQRIYIISKLIESGTVTIPQELFEYIYRKIDERLDLSEIEIHEAENFEKDIINCVTPEQQPFLKTLEQKTEEQKRIEEQERLLKQLEEKFKLLEQQAAEKEEDEAEREILYEKIREVEQQKKSLEQQLYGIQESTKGYIEDLKKTLQQKINENKQLQQLIEQLRMENAQIAESTKQYVEDLKKMLQEKIQELEEKNRIIDQLKSAKPGTKIVVQQGTGSGGNTANAELLNQNQQLQMQVQQLQMQIQQLQAENAELKNQLQGVTESTKRYVEELTSALEQKNKELEEKENKLFELEMELEILKGAQ
ncbi:MAG: hypothetical protein ACTSRZ_16050 [Promethearchaeota archaeon]